MASIGGVAALLQIGVRADTSSAVRSLRQMDATVSKSATNAKKLTTAQEQQARTLRASGMSYRNIARQMGTTEAAIRKQTSALKSSESGMRRYTTATDKAGKENKDFTQSSGTLTTKLKGVGKAAAGAAAAYVGLGAAKDAIANTEDLAKVTLALHDNMGFATKTAIQLGTQLKVRGTDAKQSAQAFATFAGVLNGASSGTQSAVDKLNQLGISGKQLKRDLEDPQQALFDVSDGLQKLGEGAARTDLQRKLFGRGWQALSPILREGSANLKQLLADAEPVSDAFGGDGVNSIRDLIKAQREAQIQSLALQVAFSKNLQPSLIALLRTFGDVIGVIRDMPQPIKNILNPLGTGIIAFQRYKKSGQTAFQAVKNAAQDVLGWFGGAWQTIGKLISKPFQDAVGSIRGFLSAIIDAINKVPILPDIDNPFSGGSGGTAVAGGAKSLGGASPTRQKGGARGSQRGGMMVPGQGPGDKIAALLEPGEFVLNREAVSAIGGGQLEKINREIPRFQFGGIVDKAKHLMQGTTGGSPLDLPGLGGLPGWLKPIGEWALGGIAKWVIGKGMGAAKAENLGGGGGSWATYDALAKKWGLSIASTFRPGAITSSGNASYHSMRDGPGRARATDYSNGYATRGEKVFGTKMARLYGSSLAELIHTPLGFSIKDGQKVAPYATADHYDHVHVAFQKGGAVRGPSGSWNIDQLTTLAKYVGMRNPALMAAIAMAESQGNPQAMGGAGDKGLWQIIPSTARAFGIDYGKLFNPFKNARGAKKIVQGPNAQGLSAWSTYNSGAYRQYLGGQVKPGLLEQLRGGASTTGKMPKAPKGGKKGKTPKVPKGAATDGELPDTSLLDAENERIRAMNELIQQGNLLALQGFQVSASQNPLLGMPSSTFPTQQLLSPLLTSLPTATASPSLAGSGVGAGTGEVPNRTYGQLPKVHVHLHSKKKGVRLEDLIDVRIEKKQRKTARKGNRRLPSGRGA